MVIIKVTFYVSIGFFFIETFEFFDDWEDRYRFIIDLGKELPNMPEEFKTEANLVRGCQSQVWLHTDMTSDPPVFILDSDAFIVRGLIAIVATAIAEKSAREIAEYDFNALFEQLDLLEHLSQTRGNGLRAMVEKIQTTAIAD